MTSASVGPVPTVPASSASITSIRRTANGLEVEVSSLAGETMTIQYSPDLSTDSWVDIGNPTVATGKATFIDRDPIRLGRKKGFYRTAERP